MHRCAPLCTAVVAGGMALMWLLTLDTTSLSGFGSGGGLPLRQSGGEQVVEGDAVVKNQVLGSKDSIMRPFGVRSQ